jgi:phenylacetic acid degradation operon negative regulatory protein
VTTERKLTARSVLLSVLLGTDPPRLPGHLLVQTTELFGISEGTTRTALSRMVAAGELRTEGRAYAIADPRLISRQARQSASRAARTRPWRDGMWRMVVVGDGGRRDAAARAAARAALAGARLAELREGVWLRPDNLDVTVEPTLGRRFRVRPDDGNEALAATLWDLDAWATEAGRLRTEMTDLVGPLEAGATDALRPGFVVSAAVLRHFQHDPLLPPSLLPAGWPGADLRRDYDRYDAAYREVLRRWFAPST